MSSDGLVHQALRYTSDFEFLDGVVPFMTKGLSTGNAVLAVTSATNIALLRGVLGRDAERVEFADADSWYVSPTRTLAALHRYVQEHAGPPGRVRVIGEPAWPERTPAQALEWARYESVVNLAFAGSGAWLMCPYDLRTAGPWVAHMVQRTHPELVAGQSLPTVSHAYTDPAAFAAECDRVPLAPPGAPVRELPFGPGDLSHVRAFAHGGAVHAGLDDERRADVCFAVNEVAINALTHGGGRGVLRVWEEWGALLLEVDDPGGSVVAAFSGQLPPEDPGGSGLWVVRQLCDLVEMRLRREGTTVRLHFTVPPGP